MDLRIWLTAALMMSLAGCAGDEPSVETQEPEETPEGPPVNGTVAANITAFTVNITSGIPATANFTFNGSAESWSLDADGDGVADANGTQLPGNATYVYEAAGNYSAVLSLVQGNQTLHQTLDINLTLDAAPVVAPASESGSVVSTTAGAPPQAVIGRVPFTIGEGHATLEITTFLEDPAATELDQTYVVRITPPSGGNDDHTVSYGETITLDAPESGSWEIGVFPAGAGAWDWTADYCAFTGTC